MNRKEFILLLAFIFSRIFFINPLPVFFDSPEYLRRLSDPNYFQAIASGHIPFHAGYVLLFWPVFQFASHVGINPVFSVILVQIIVSAFTIYCFYGLINLISNNKIAGITAIIFALTPLYWIMNVSLMVESAYINLFIISLFLFSQCARKIPNPKLYLLAGCLTLGLAILTNPLVVLWMPLVLSVIYFLKKEKVIPIFLSITLTVLVAVLMNGFFIANAFHIPFDNGIRQYYLLGEDFKISPNISSSLTILRFVRNAFISLFQSNTAIIFILGIISFMKIFKTNIKLSVITCLWILPSILTSQWYDPLLFGRHGAIAGFGLVLLAAIFLEERKKLFAITITYLLIVSLPALTLLKQPIPYLETAKFVQTLPKGLLIETHFARPQVEANYPGEIIFVNQPGWSKEKLKDTIDDYLTNKKPIFITSQALSDPYGIYSGPFLYSLSLSYANKFELEDVITSYLTKKYAVIDNDAGIIVYEIVSRAESQYPEIPILIHSRHRIDYSEPATQLWFLVERAHIIQSHSIIKG
jgi:hypothetical protein